MWTTLRCRHLRLTEGWLEARSVSPLGRGHAFPPVRGVVRGGGGGLVHPCPCPRAWGKRPRVAVRPRARLHHHGGAAATGEPCAKCGGALRRRRRRRPRGARSHVWGPVPRASQTWLILVTHLLLLLPARRACVGFRTMDVCVCQSRSERRGCRRRGVWGCPGGGQGWERKAREGMRGFGFFDWQFVHTKTTVGRTY